MTIMAPYRDCLIGSKEILPLIGGIVEWFFLELTYFSDSVQKEAPSTAIDLN